jgi:hypothetical protein
MGERKRSPFREQNIFWEWTSEEQATEKGHHDAIKYASEVGPTTAETPAIAWVLAPAGTWARAWTLVTEGPTTEETPAKACVLTTAWTWERSWAPAKAWTSARAGSPSKAGMGGGGGARSAPIGVAMNPIDGCAQHTGRR